MWKHLRSYVAANNDRFGNRTRFASYRDATATALNNARF